MSSFAIDFSGPQAPANWNSIYVKNVHHKQTREELAANFTIFGDISRIDVVEFTRPNGLMGKNAFVHFLNWRDNDFSCDTRRDLETQFAMKRADVTYQQTGVQYQVGRNRYFLFINEKPIAVEPMNLHQLTIGNRQLEAILLDQRKIVAAHEERIAKLEYELSEMERLFHGRGISERTMSSESDIQLAGPEIIKHLNSSLSDIPESDMMRIVYGPGGKPLNNGEPMHISELDISDMKKKNE